MTFVSSKPNDDDSVVQVREDALGNKYLTPTKLLITFWDDLINSISALNSNAAEDNNFLAQISQVFKALESQEKRVDSKTAYLESLVRSIKSDFRPFNAVSVSSAYTARNYDFVNVKVGAPITFPDNPVVNSELIVRVGDTNPVPINGNSRNINGSRTGKLFRFGTSIRFKYFIDDNEWFAI